MGGGEDILRDIKETQKYGLGEKRRLKYILKVLMRGLSSGFFWGGWVCEGTQDGQDSWISMLKIDTSFKIAVFT